MGLSSFFSRQLIGLDIGVSGIKAVELSGRRNPRLVAYNRLPLPWDSIAVDGEIRNRAVVISALKRLFDSKAFSSTHVAVGATGPAIITRKISVPRMTAQELGEQLYWEAEQYIPFNVEEVNLDFAIIGNSSQNQSSSPMMDVLLVAAKKDYINSLTSLVTDAGLVPDVVDIQAFALGNAFEFNYAHTLDKSIGESANMIVDFGAGSTKISIVESDKTTFARELRQSGIECTDLLSKRLQISLDEAERMKIGQANLPEVNSVIAEYNHSVTEEISRTVDFYISQSTDRAIQGIYICGGASKTAGLSHALEVKLAIPVSPLNPVQNIAGSGRSMNAQAIRELTYLGAIAIGLGLRISGDSR